MAYKIVWSSRADNDVENTKKFYDSIDNPKAKRDFLARLYEQVSMISMNPLAGRQTDEPGYRKIVLSKHKSIFYKIEGEYIIIGPIFDNRQDPDSLNL